MLLACVLAALLARPAAAQEGPSLPAPASNTPAPLPSIEVAPEAAVVPPPRQVEAVPPPREVLRLRLELVWAGAGLFTAVWAADRMIGSGASTSWVPWLPLVGPWYLLGQERQQQGENPGILAVLALDGLAQLGGVTIAVLGTVLHKKRQAVVLPPASLGPASGASLSF